MEQREFLLELGEAFDRLSCGLDVMKLMVLGLEDIQSPWADGFYAAWKGLDDVEKEIRRLLDAVAGAGTAA